MQSSIHPSIGILFAVLLWSAIIGGCRLSPLDGEGTSSHASEKQTPEPLRSVNALHGDVQPVLGTALVNGFVESYSLQETMIKGGHAGDHVCPSSLKRIVAFYADETEDASRRRIQEVLGRLVVMETVHRMRHIPEAGMTSMQLEWSDQRDRATHTVSRFLETESRRAWSESMESLALRVHLRPCTG